MAELETISKNQLQALAEADLIDLTDEEIEEIGKAQVPAALVKMADQIINDGIGKVRNKMKAETLNPLDETNKRYKGILGEEEFGKISQKFSGKTYQMQGQLIAAVEKKIQTLSAQQSKAEQLGNDDKAEALQAKIDELMASIEGKDAEMSSKLSERNQEVKVERAYDKAFLLAAKTGVFSKEELDGRHTEDNFLKDLKDTIADLKLVVNAEGKLVKEDGKPRIEGKTTMDWPFVVQKAKETGGWGNKSTAAVAGSYVVSSSGQAQVEKTAKQLAEEKTFGR